MPLLAALLIAVLVSPPSAASAQVRPITGRVTDDQGRPVADADVEAVRLGGTGFTRGQSEPGQGPRWRARTNVRGEYAVRVPSSGSYLVTAAKAGAGSAQTQVIVELDGLSVVDLRLWKPDAVSANPDCAAALRPRPQRNTAKHPSLDRLFRWLQAVEAHAPGCPDDAVREIGAWEPAEFESLLLDVAGLAAFLRWTDRLDSGPSAEFVSTLDPLSGTGTRDSRVRFMRDSRGVAWIVLHQHQLTLASVQEVFKGNATIKRAALLHADITLFVPGTFNRYVVAQDGRQRGGRPGTVHWLVGRSLIDLITPSPESDSDALMWYRAVSAHLFDSGHLAHLAHHLEKARQVFPAEPRFLLETAYLHLELSSPSIQSAARELRDSGIGVTTDTAGRELEHAEQWLRRTIALAPEDSEARLRLGRALDDLGRTVEAEGELRTVLTAAATSRQQYLGHLFLGRIAERTGRRADARVHYLRAASLFPGAQSARLAVAHLELSSGNASRAMEALGDTLDRSLSSAERDDPWLYYYKPLLGLAAPLMGEMRRRLAGTLPGTLR